jgi:hypothetical protein
MQEQNIPTVAELHPHVLYRKEADAARFATWRLSEGHEALALFTTTDGAKKYRDELSESKTWTLYEPPRGKLIEILAACRAAGILYAALDPIGGSAKTLFDIPRVLAAAEHDS